MPCLQLVAALSFTEETKHHSDQHQSFVSVRASAYFKR